MWIDFDQIADDARVWVYQASRPLSEADSIAVEQSLQPALNGWAAHGQPLVASARVLEDRFVVVAVDENQALPSGCSIDASVHFVQSIGQQLGQAGAPVDFMDRSAAYQSADGSVKTLALPDIKTAVADGRLTPETRVFNTLVKTKAEFLSHWQLKAADTWLKRYFKNATV
ncbi:MAG: hypothetical protein H7Z72_17840 [Bacteroidetes bacterium]|nr:hypothetical protein [Fibrella sp.]